MYGFFFPFLSLKTHRENILLNKYALFCFVYGDDYMLSGLMLDHLLDIVSSAKFVLIVEKDATFQRLLDGDFCTKLHPCIMITASFFLISLYLYFACESE